MPIIVEKQMIQEDEEVVIRMYIIPADKLMQNECFCLSNPRGTAAPGNFTKYCTCTACTVSCLHHEYTYLCLWLIISVEILYVFSSTRSVGLI